MISTDLTMDDPVESGSLSSSNGRPLELLAEDNPS